MSSSAFVKLGYEEVVALHSKAANWVYEELRRSNTDNPSMQLAPYVECKYARNAFVCPLKGVNTLNLTLDEMNHLNTLIPGATIYTERMPDASEIRYELIIPILVPRGTDTRRIRSSAGGGSPTLEWALLLAAVEAGLCGIFYYRWAAGLVF